MNLTQPASLDDVRALIRAFGAHLDPASRYRSELHELVAASADLADLERRLLAGCRGLRHAGPDVFAAMTLREKILANLVTPETTLFRFTEGELEALDREILPRLHGRTARVLIVPCSLGDEAFTMAAFMLKRNLAFEICAFDFQPQLIEIARTGRLTFGYPPEYLAAAGRVSDEVLRRIRFDVGDAFNLPLDGSAPFDVVLCRNFLGYFVPEKALEAAQGLAARVAPGGVLFLDGFCLVKFPALQPALESARFARQGDRPVFLRSV